MKVSSDIADQSPSGSACNEPFILTTPHDYSIHSSTLLHCSFISYGAITAERPVSTWGHKACLSVISATRDHIHRLKRNDDGAVTNV